MCVAGIPSTLATMIHVLLSSIHISVDGSSFPFGSFAEFAFDERCEKKKLIEQEANGE